MVVAESEGCTGTLIAPNLVLTARHCVAAISSGTGAVQCGTSEFGAEHAPSEFVVTWDANMQDGIGAGTTVSVSDVRTPTLTDVCGTDVALLILGRAVPAGSAEPIAPRLDSGPQPNELFDAVGYGITNPNDQSGMTFGRRLHVDDLRVRCTGTSCAGATATEWSATTPVCSGDSGGPALDGSGRVIGVASRGDQNCTGAIYSSPYSWRNLITDTAKDAAAMGGYPLPPWAGGSAADAGTPTDAGTAGDAGPATDAGTSVDAGTTPPDAGNPSDAGPPLDAGPRDSGTSDAGSGSPDDGGSLDAGEDDAPRAAHGVDDEAAGCGCRTAHRAPSQAASAALLFLAAALVLRRRSVSRRASAS